MRLLLVRIGQRSTLVFAGEGFEEALYFCGFFGLHRAAHLILRHHLNRLVERRHAAVVVVRPGEGYVAERGRFEAVAVALVLGLCPAAVVGIGQARLGVDFAVFDVVLDYVMVELEIVD